VRIASLLPSATEVVFALGLGDELVGRSHSCDFPPAAQAVPALTSPRPFRGESTSRRVHERVRRAARTGSGPTMLDAAALAAARPDLVLTQATCPGCGAGHAEVAAVLRDAGMEATIVDIEPVSIEGIFNAISTIGAMADAEDEAVGLLEILRERLSELEEQVQRRRARGVQPRRVVCLEWLDPPFGTGLWIPEQVRRAGGWDVLGSEGGRAPQTTWKAVMEVDPEQLLLMPCGMTARQAADEWARTERPAGFAELRAVRRGEVVALDGSAYFDRPGPRVIDGIALLAELFDPQGFEDVAPPDGWIPLGV
jgi:iron complex transport system substrate-binding protein